MENKSTTNVFKKTGLAVERIRERELQKTQNTKSPNNHQSTTSNSNSKNSNISVKENKQRPPFNLVNYSPLLRINELNEKEQLEVFWDIYRKYNPIAESSLPLNKKKLTLHYIVSYAERLFSNDIAPIIRENETLLNANDKKGNPNLKSMIAACLLRTQRFRIKWVALYLLYQGVPAPNIGVTKQLDKLRSRMESIIIQFDFTELNQDMQKGPVISVESTINLINKQLTACEFNLKALMPGIGQAMGLAPIDPKFGVDNNTFDALTHIAPKGFIELQDDYYYICRLILADQISLPFSTEKKTLPDGTVIFPQRPQWESYYNEFVLLFHLYWASGLKPDMSFLAEKNKGNIINLPFEKFIVQKEFSNNTFSRIISASNNFIFRAWLNLALCTFNLRQNQQTSKSV